MISFLLAFTIAIAAILSPSTIMGIDSLNFDWHFTSSDMKINTSSCMIKADGQAQCQEHLRRTALITGGAGFVGRHFTKRLCDDGFSVTIVDNLRSESSLHPDKWPEHLICKDSSSSIVFIEADCQEFFKNPASFGIAAFKISWDLVIHLAAVIGGREAIEDDSLNVVTTNLDIDASTFKWAANHAKSIGKFIYFSSSAVYPVILQSSDSPSLLEESMVDLRSSIGTGGRAGFGFPDLGYGWSKLVGEYLSHEAHERNGLKVAVFRPMSGYGEDQHEAYPFRSILNRVMNKRESPVDLWSDATRDFMHIDDIVSCVLSVQGSIESADVVNLGTGVPTSFSELAAMMHRVVWKSDGKIETNILPNKPLGVSYRVANTSKMIRLGCNVNISLLEGISRSVEIIKDARSGIKREDKNINSVGSSSSNSREGKEEYSRMHCLGGSQSFDGWMMQHTHYGFPSTIEPHLRVCKMENVCIINERFVYFEDPKSGYPERAKMSRMSSPFLYLGYRNASIINPGLPIDFEVSSEPFPSDTYELWDNNITYLLSKTSNDDNFGHILFDNLLPALAAADIFNISIEDTRLAFLGCYDFPTIIKDGIPHVWANPYYDDGKEISEVTLDTDQKLISRRDICLHNYKLYPPLVLGHQAIDLFYYFNEKQNTDLCFKSVIMGQSSAFSLSSLDLQRSSLIRKARDNIVRRLKLEGIPRPTKQRILVLIKTLGFQGKMNVTDICSSVIESVATIPIHRKSIFENVEISCKVPSNQSVAEQVADSRRSTVIVAEHGTISYGALYTHDGAVLLSIGSRDILKEPQTLLFTSTFHTLYMVHEELDQELGKYLLMALDIASTNFGIV